MDYRLKSAESNVINGSNFSKLSLKLKFVNFQQHYEGVLFYSTRDGGQSS